MTYKSRMKRDALEYARRCASNLADIDLFAGGPGSEEIMYAILELVSEDYPGLNRRDLLEVSARAIRLERGVRLHGAELDAES
jgi:hypothetical protein